MTKRERQGPSVPMSRRDAIARLMAGGALAAGSGLGLGFLPRGAHAEDWVQPTIRPRSVVRHTSGTMESVGGGIRVRRTIPTKGVPDVDPFIFLDLFDLRVPAGAKATLPPHPHRGFAPVSVIMEGAMGHRDSLGNRGIIDAGGIQWMTAGRGIQHADHADVPFLRRGGRMMGVQLWVNMPRRAKMLPAGLQEATPAQVPVVEHAGARARILAGEALGKASSVRPHTPMLVVDYVLAPRAVATLPFPAHWNAFAQVCEGAIRAEGHRHVVRPQQLVTFARGGTGIRIACAGDRPARVLVGAGEPIGEPIVRSGPFVMTSQAEIRQAWSDYRAGKMGHLAR